MPITLFRSASTQGGWQDAGEVESFLAVCERFLARDRPDVVWTYGGDAASVAVQLLAKRFDLPILFALHNFGYPDPATFSTVDYVIVPTEFCRRYYWDTLGLACRTLPLVVDPGRARAPERKPRCVTFVNPEPRKGIHVFARIAEILGRRRRKFHC